MNVQSVNANGMLMLKLTALYSSGGKRDGACTREGGKCNARSSDNTSGESSKGVR